MPLRKGLSAITIIVGVVVAGVVLAGCSNRESAEFQVYVADTPKNKADNPVKPSGQKPQSTKNTSKAAAKPSGTKSTENDFSKILPAALGFSSRMILSDNFRIPAELWLNPAIGPAATIAMLARIDASNRPRKTVPPKREVKVLIQERKFRKEGPQGALRISYDDIDLLKILNMDPVTPDAPKLMPPWLKNLHGKRIRIRGFMSSSTFQSTGLKGFMMGRDNKACCFPGRAKIYDLFPVIMQKGKTTNYISNRPFDVVGIFQIKLWVEDGEILRLYQIVDAVLVQ